MTPEPKVVAASVSIPQMSTAEIVTETAELPMTPAEAVEALDALYDADVDQEVAHVEADELLLGQAPTEVAEAYKRARTRIGFWYA